MTLDTHDLPGGPFCNLLTQPTPTEERGLPGFRELSPWPRLGLILNPVLINMLKNPELKAAVPLSFIELGVWSG